MPSIQAFEEARTLRGASRPSRILEGSSVARDSVYEGTVCTLRFCRLKLSVQLSDLIRDKPILASSEILHIARLPITRPKYGRRTERYFTERNRRASLVNAI
jgi:hypothetical protein